MKHLTATIINNGELSAKEAEVLRLLCEGYYRPEIALKLHRTISTVSKHVEHIAEKLNAHGSTEIVLIAEKLGLVEIHLIKRDHHTLIHCLLILLIFSQLLGQSQGRRPPQTPRPSVRLVRKPLA